MPLPTRIGRLRPPVLCFVVSRATVPDGDIVKAVTEAVAGGVNIVQLREPEASARELLELIRSLKPVTRGKALLIVSDRLDVALAAEIDGVQVPEDGLPTRTARQLIGRYAVVGRSVHDVETAHNAGRDGAEFVLAGTIYKSSTHPDHKPTGPGLIAEITKDSALPVLAIGGITVDKVDEVIKAGAAGVAVVSAIAGAKDMKAAAEELTKALREAWDARTAVSAERVIESGIAIVLNGNEHSLPGEMSLAGLAASLDIDRRTVAIAHNGEVVRREAHEQVIVRNGDRVEIVRMVGGG